MDRPKSDPSPPMVKEFLPTLLILSAKSTERFTFTTPSVKNPILRPSFSETEEYDTRAHAVCGKLLATVGFIQKTTAATISVNDLINSMNLSFYKIGENGRNMVKISLDWKHFPESD